MKSVCLIGFATMVVLMAACGRGAAMPPASPAASPAQQPSPVAAPTQQPGQPCIESMVMREGKFAPVRLVIRTNCAVLFTNRDEALIQIQGHDFTLGEMGKDQAWAHTYKEPGSFEIFNTNNPAQRAAVVVQP